MKLRRQPILGAPDTAASGAKNIFAHAQDRLNFGQRVAKDARPSDRRRYGLNTNVDKV